LDDASGALSDLRKSLHRLRAAIDRTGLHQRHESEIGQVLLVGQRKLTELVVQAQAQAAQIIASAEAEARDIVSNARDEVQQMAGADRSASPAPADTVRQLQSAINGFEQVNHELLREITALRHALDVDTREPPEN